MATHSEAGGPAKTNDKVASAKLGEDFVPNEPLRKSGMDKEGVPNQTLGASQAERAATEALLSLRPQPSAEEVKKVLEGLAASDKQYKTAKEAGEAAVAELNRVRTPA